MGEIKKLQCEERRHGLHHMKDQQKRKYRPKPPAPTTQPSIPITTTHNSTAKIF